MGLEKLADLFCGNLILLKIIPIKSEKPIETI